MKMNLLKKNEGSLQYTSHQYMLNTLALLTSYTMGNTKFRVQSQNDVTLHLQLMKLVNRN